MRFAIKHRPSAERSGNSFLVTHARVSAVGSLANGGPQTNGGIFSTPAERWAAEDCGTPFSHLRRLKQANAKIQQPVLLIAERRITEERLRRDLARVSVADGDGRDIVETVDRDAFVIRDRSIQRPDLLALVVNVVHAFSLPFSDLCAAQK